MKIAICDDDLHDLQWISTLVYQYNNSLDTTLFSSSSSLLQAFDANFYDLVLLDIEMESPNGFETAQMLKKRKDAPLVVFITNSGDYTIRGYGVAFRYLPKPVTLESLSQVLSLAIDQILPQKLTIQQGKSIQILSFRDILYVESNGHFVIIHTLSHDYTFRLNLKDLINQFPNGLFAKSHHSFLINLNAIDSVTGKYLQLSTGEQLPISQSYRKSLEAALICYLNR